MTLPFPPNCPPPGASPKPGLYYRMAHKGRAAGETTIPDDWRRPYETPRSRLVGNDSDPEAHGLSVYSDVQDLLELKKVAARFVGKPVAEVDIGPGDGDLVHAPTNGDSHHNWWTEPYNLIPSAVVVAVIGKNP